MNEAEPRWLLGGEFAPLGSGIAFMECPLDIAVGKLVEWRTGLGLTIETHNGGTLPSALGHLDPMDHTVELLIEHGKWTAYLNNGRGGTDLSNNHLWASLLNANWVTAQHQERYGPGHAITEFSMGGPERNEPFSGERTVYTYAADGRWEFNAYGVEQPFEQTSAYSARLKRDRLTRQMLLDYLANFGIFPDDTEAFGRSVVVHKIVDYDTHSISLADEREWESLPPLDPAIAKIISIHDLDEPPTHDGDARHGVINRLVRLIRRRSGRD